MEGYLIRKCKDKSFGSGWLSEKCNTWQKQWFELDDQTVTIYEDFNLSLGKPINKISSFSIQDCEVLPVAHKTKKFAFCVKEHSTQNSLLYAQAEDAKMLGVWLKALSSAASGEHHHPAVDYEYYYNRLGLDSTVDYEPSVVNRTFRNLVAESPVGNDGRALAFKELQEAFNHIMAHLNDKEEARNVRMVCYEAVIVKGGPGEGLGIVVQEEPDGRNVVKAAKSSLRIKSITGEVGEDGIEVGDELLQIEGVDVSNMPLLRVAQRMNDFRIPPYTAAKLTFGRKVLRRELNPDTSECEDYFGTSSVISSEAGLALHSQQQEYEDNTTEELQEVELPPQQESEYTRSLSHRSLSRGTSSEKAGILPSGSGISMQDSSRHSSRNPSPLAARVLSPSPDLPPTNPSVKPSSRPSSAGSRRGDISRSEERTGSMRFAASPSQRNSMHSPTSAVQEQFSASAPLPRSSMKSRQASIASNRGSISGNSPLSTTHADIGDQDLAKQQQQVPSSNHTSSARPLSSKVEAINSKDYFKQHTLQMKSPAEIAEMKRDLDFCLKELQQASKRMEELEFHNTYLESELSRYKALYTDSARHERLLETQLEQYLVHSTVTPEFIEESMNDMIYVSNQIANNQPLQVTDEVATYLDDLGLSEQELGSDGAKVSQRNAIAATAAVDKSGLMLQKWAMTGDSVAEKLHRFEERVQRLDAIGVLKKSPAASPSSSTGNHERSQQQQQFIYKQPQSYRQQQSPQQQTMTSPSSRSSPREVNGSNTNPRSAPLRRHGSQQSVLSATTGSTNVGNSQQRAYNTDPQAAAQLFRQSSWQASTSSSAARTAARPPVVKSNTVSGAAIYQQQHHQPQQLQKPLVSTLLSRPMNLDR